MAAAHEQIGRKLAALQGRAIVEAADALAKQINERWQTEMPFAHRDLYLLVGPAPDPLLCSGQESASETRCSRAWRDSEPPTGP
jgi:hypothetical protein